MLGPGAKETPAGPRKEFTAPLLRSLQRRSLPLLGEQPDCLTSETEDQMLSSSLVSQNPIRIWGWGGCLEVAPKGRHHQQVTGGKLVVGRERLPGTLLLSELGSRGIWN